MTFAELDLKPDVLRALKNMGFEDLTPIQELAIPPVLEGRDLVGVAETGSGKTGACGIPLVNMADPGSKDLQALILVPTRELAQQYVSELADISRHCGIAPFAMYGGFDMSIQRAKLRDGVQILVATPGRFIDYVWNNKLTLSGIRTVVLDEADEMLRMGFIENVDDILAFLVHDHQTLLFSATMPPEVGRLADTYLTDPVKVELTKDQKAPSSLAHHFAMVNDRLEALHDYVRETTIKQALIFCNSRSGVDRLFRQLRERQDGVDLLHGGMEQTQRTAIYRGFRSQKIRYLIATDVAARGLDFDHVTHVINYEFPRSPVSYTHRTGRAGRMGRTGVAMTFVTASETRDLDRLLKTNQVDPVWQGDPPRNAEKSVNGSGKSPGGSNRRGGRRRRSGGGR